MTVDITRDARAGGSVERYHTWRTIQRQSTSEHMWNVVRIMLAIWPDCPRRMVVAALFHDVAEMVGDLPYPMKRNDPVLKERMDAAENDMYDAMSERWMLPKRTVLSKYEHQILKLCDMLEMWEFGVTEQNMGNNYAALIATRCLSAVQQMLMKIDHPSDMGFPDVKPRVRQYIETRSQQERGEFND